MTRLHCALLFGTLSALTTIPAHGADFADHIALEGFTGVINTPNAYVTPDSRVEFSANNQLESQFIGRYPDGHSYLFSMGVFPHIEFGGRLAVRNNNSRNSGNVRGGNRDLSANVKLQLPWQRPYLPRLAIGAQDFGGGANNFRSNYVVASETLGPLQLSIGYGFGTDRMDGTFGGVELRTFDWLYLLADNDGSETNSGLRLVAPHPLFGVMETSLTAKLHTNGRADNVAFGLNVRIPLGNDHHNSAPIASRNASMSDSAAGLATPRNDATNAPATDGAADPRAQSDSSHAENSPPSTTTIALPSAVNAHARADDDNAAYDRLIQRLQDLGFQSVRVGRDRGDTLYVQFENVRYNHNFLDGMGLVLGVAATFAPSDIATIDALAVKRDIAIMRVAVPAALYRSFLASPTTVMNELRGRMRVKRASDFDDARIDWHSNDANATRTRLDLILRPDVRTWVGTEYGTIDYSLALHTDARFNLWRGAFINTGWDTPVDNSDDLEAGHPYNASIHHAGLRDAFLQQMFPITDTMTNLTSIGSLATERERYNGGWNETMWNPNTGPHSVRAKLGFFKAEYSDTERTMWTAYYDYFWAPKDVVLEVNYGQYWFQDRGFIFLARRFFGDTAITAFAKYNGDKSAGFGVSFPLTPRQDPKPGIVQVRGTNRWAYDIQTSIGLAPNSNPINTRITVDRNPTYTLQKDVLDAGRLNAPYVREHVLRLRDAYWVWGATRSSLD